MSVDMERSRDNYRGRYRDRHNSGSTSRNHNDDRSTRGNYRGRPSHGNDNNSRSNGNYSSRTAPATNTGYNYRSSRNSLNSRPVLSRNGPSTHYRHHRDDDYPPPPHLISPSSSRIGSSGQSNYYDNHSSSSRFDRPPNNREMYASLLGDQPILSSGLPPPTALYYGSSQSIPSLRDRGLPPAHYIDSERNRYTPSSSAYRRDSPPPPPPLSSYRNERSMEYGPRSLNNDIYMREDYRPPTPPSLASLSVRGDPYGDIYRANDYGGRSERFDIPPNRNNSSSREYQMASVPSSAYRTDLYRSSSSASMPSPSSYITREQYAQPLVPMRDVNYRPISQSRDYGIATSSSSSRTNYTSPSPSSMDHQPGGSRNNRDRNTTDYHSSSSYRDRPNLKRSGSRYNDNGPIPSKRPMRR